MKSVKPVKPVTTAAIVIEWTAEPNPPLSRRDRPQGEMRVAGPGGITTIPKIFEGQASALARTIGADYRKEAHDD